MGQAEGAAQEELVAGIERGTSVICVQVVLIRGEARRGRGVAIRIIECIVAKERKLCARPDVEIANQLILAECSF